MRDAVSQSVACPLRMQGVPGLTLTSGSFFHGKVFPSLAISRRASCQLLVKEYALSTGNLPPGGLPRNSVVK